MNSTHSIQKINTRLGQDVIKPAEYIVPLANGTEANLYGAERKRTMLIVKTDQISLTLVLWLAWGASVFTDIKPSKSIKSCRHLRRRDWGIVSLLRAKEPELYEAHSEMHLWVAKWKIITNIVNWRVSHLLS